MKEFVGYLAEVTEFERGWGCRPDGYVVCLDKAVGIAYSKKSNGHIWSMDDGSEFSDAGDFKLVILTESGHDKLAAFNKSEQYPNLAWIGRNDLKEYIKE